MTRQFPVNIKTLSAKRSGFCVWGFCLWLFSSLAYPFTLDEVKALADAGAPGLALSLMDEHQPDIREQANDWYEWELLRVRILNRWQEWERGIKRFENIPQGLPPRIARWGKGQQAWFYLSNGDGETARKILRNLMWQTEEPHIEEIRIWRRLLVRSYLVSGLPSDAMAAMQRYQLDYQDEDPRWQLLQLKVRLSAGRPAGAEGLVAKLEGDEAVALKLLVKLRNGEPPTEIYSQARTLATSKDISVRSRAIYWSLAAQAGEVMLSSASIALALDQGARYLDQLSSDDDLFMVDGDRLWNAYADFGRQIANNVQLLYGNDEPWFTEAEASLQQTPVRARALLTVMATRATTPGNKTRAHVRLAEILAAEEGGQQVLSLLYLRSQRYAEYAQIPIPVRHILIDQALNASDIETATRLFADLQQAPLDANVFEWNLRRARVLVMGGQVAAGTQVLQDLFVTDTQLSQQQLDRFLQVIFDLQVIDAHEAAIQLLERVHAFATTPKSAREIWFWRADSLKAVEKYAEAARAYLLSATIIDPNLADPWSQTARYNAAQALGKAGLVDDAKRIYDYLLRITTEEARIAVLRSQLQKLHLQRESAANIH